MRKKVIPYIGKDGHGDVTVYKFDNTPEDQAKAKDLLASGKSKNKEPRTGLGISYIVPFGTPRNWYKVGDFKKKKEGVI